MPIETFTVFVAEQAVGIAIGVVAVAAAPKIVPGLARTAQNVKQRGTELCSGFSKWAECCCCLSKRRVNPYMHRLWAVALVW